MIRHLSYVVCDYCEGNPAQPGDDSLEARVIAWQEGYTRRKVDGRKRPADVCRTCSAVL